MNPKSPEQEMRMAAIATQLSIAITETLDPPEMGNEFYMILCDWWARKGRAQEWLGALDSIDDIKRIAFTKDANHQWALAVEWNEG